MRIILELIRLILLLGILGAFMGGIVNNIYGFFRVDLGNSYLGLLPGLSIFIVFSVLYRNKLQFSGYYKGDGRIKLFKRVSISLVSCSLILLIVAPLLH
ncbi:hypothetical protein PB01_10260 [Psychrobacillus glaciei]|uniref:Uncharacterized protein n=1 Tax=Psychrobacillus glaciei TaxID=2283160 RepID=A0A5J6SNB3_9BACI|nr:hypothetical protein PB01_10260 [Psychrobacillus glaciei]